MNVSWEVSGSGCRHRSRKVSAVIERSSQLNVRIVKSNWDQHKWDRYIVVVKYCSLYGYGLQQSLDEI